MLLASKKQPIALEDATFYSTRGVGHRANPRFHCRTPSTAAAVVARIREKCQLIAHHPEIGQRRAEFPGDYHGSTLDRWVIFYRVTEDAVEIHRVLDGSRDIGHLMG